jgi:hypothetical protein
MSSSTKKLEEFADCYESFHAHNESHLKFRKFVDEILTADSGAVRLLNASKSCLAIGPCDGLNELMLIRRCMPALQRLTAVERDATSAEQFAGNIQRLRQDGIGTTLQNCNVINRTVQDFLESRDGKTTNGDDRYDVVLLLHVIYYLSSEERRVLFEALTSGQLLKPGGLVVINYEGSGGQFVLTHALNSRCKLPSCEQLAAELADAGMKLVRKYEHSYSCDHSNPDQTLVDFYREYVESTASVDEFKAIVESVWPGGKTDNCRVSTFFCTV